MLFMRLDLSEILKIKKHLLNSRADILQFLKHFTKYVHVQYDMFPKDLENVSFDVGC